MNNRGFTFIELVVTVGLLALMGVIIGTNMVSVQSKQMAKNYEGYKKQIAEAACAYIESKEIIVYRTNNFIDTEMLISKEECLNASKCYVRTDVLMAEGYLSEALENPATGNNVTDIEVVEVSFDHGVKTCKYYSAS